MAKLLNWASKSCVKSDLVLTATGQMKFIGVRAQSKSLREYQRLIRTNIKNWEVELSGSLPPGWIRLITEDCYDKEKNMDARPETSHNPDARPYDAEVPMHDIFHFQAPSNLLLVC